MRTSEKRLNRPCQPVSRARRWWENLTKRTTVVALAIVVLLLFPTRFFADAHAAKKLNNQSNSPTSINQLRRIIRLINTKQLLSKRDHGPFLHINGDAFFFDQGDVPKIAGRHSYASVSEKPILIPLARLIQLDDLKQLINNSQGADPAFWKPYFDEAEAIIEQKMLPVIASVPTGDKALTQQAALRVAEYDLEIEKIFGETAPNAFGKSHGLRREIPPRPAPLRHRITVTFSISPKPARLFLVTETAYKVARSTGDEPPWREILEDNPELGGWYWYQIQWPDQTRQGRIEVYKDEQIIRITK